MTEHSFKQKYIGQIRSHQNQDGCRRRRNIRGRIAEACLYFKISSSGIDVIKFFFLNIYHDRTIILPIVPFYVILNHT